MIGNARNDAALADTAIASLAVVKRIKAGFLESVDDGLVGGDLDDLSAGRYLHLERRILGGSLI